MLISLRGVVLALVHIGSKTNVLNFELFARRKIVMDKEYKDYVVTLHPTLPFLLHSQSNRCLACLQELQQEYVVLKKKFEILFQLEQEIVKNGGTVPTMD
uniref:Uncharacterized protein n=1 Tax=Chenopodium quinoa TaxID=63459 RepID=A0A803MSN4_CHEQI